MVGNGCCDWEEWDNADGGGGERENDDDSPPPPAEPRPKGELPCRGEWTECMECMECMEPALVPGAPCVCP